MTLTQLRIKIDEWNADLHHKMMMAGNRLVTEGNKTSFRNEKNEYVRFPDGYITGPCTYDQPGVIGGYYVSVQGPDGWCQYKFTANNADSAAEWIKDIRAGQGMPVDVVKVVPPAEQVNEVPDTTYTRMYRLFEGFFGDSYVCVYLDRIGKSYHLSSEVHPVELTDYHSRPIDVWGNFVDMLAEFFDGEVPEFSNRPDALDAFERTIGKMRKLHLLPNPDMTAYMVWLSALGNQYAYSVHAMDDLGAFAKAVEECKLNCGADEIRLIGVIQGRAKLISWNERV